MSRHSKRLKLMAPYTHQDYTVCWICALPQELTAATVMLDERHEDLPRPLNSKDSNSYTLGSINNGSGKHNIVIACLPKGRTGNISAASVAINAINTFPNIKIGLLIGTGSGVPQKGRIRLGDVVVSVPTEGASAPIPSVIQWGLDGSNSRVKQIGALNSPPDLLLTALSKLESENELNGGSKIPEYIEQLKVNYPKIAGRFARSETLEDILFKATYPHVFGSYGLGHSAGARQGLGEEEGGGEKEDEDEDEEENIVCEFCDRSQIVKRKGRPSMRVHYGAIASGDRIVHDGAFRDKLNMELGGTILCIETEAAGLMNEFPCIVVRGISDYGDSHRSDMWQGHAAAAAAGFAKELVTCIHSSDLEQEPSLKQLIQIKEDLCKIKADVTTVRSGMTKERDTKILKWLGRHYGPEQSDFIKERQAGTGEWLLKSTEFLAWMGMSPAMRQNRDSNSKISNESNTCRTLFCPGIPGAGKTIMTATVIDYLQNVFRSNIGVCIAYVYCSYQFKNEQTVENLLSSLLTQLTQYQSSMPGVIETLYADSTRNGLTPTLSQISEALKSVASLCSRVFILVDALDECTCYRALLPLIFDLQLNTNSNIRIFATSRPNQDIVGFFERPEIFNIKIHANEDDVRTYVRNHLSQQDLISAPIERLARDKSDHLQGLAPVFDRSSDLCTQIEDHIVEACNGMFLLIKLRLNYLSSATSLREIQDILEESQKLHTANEDEDQTMVYKEAYHKTMEAIMSQSELSRRRAAKAISWVLFARRAITVFELQHAIAIDAQTVDFDDTNISPKAIIMNICKSLLTINERDEVHLIHYTAQVYFEKTKNLWFPQAQQEIARACIRYLTYETNIFKTTDLALQKSEFMDGMEKRYVLFRYATQFWGDHARESFFERDRQEEILALLAHKNIPQIARYCYSLFIQRNLSMSQQFRRHVLGLHIAAMFGLKHIVLSLLRHDPDLLDARDLKNDTPFMKAMEYGHESVGKILLDKGADANSLVTKGSLRDWDIKPLPFKTFCLVHAARNGHPGVVKLLLDEFKDIDTGVSDFTGENALWWAATEGFKEVVEVLLDRGACIEGSTKPSSSPLWAAVKKDRLQVVKLLINRGANIEGNKVKTPLSWAVDRSRYDMVKLLAREGANIDPRDHYKRTPLLRAISNKRHAIVDILIESGANLGATDGAEDTALITAVLSMSEALVQRVLSTGRANLEGMNACGDTALSLAVALNNEAVVRLLLKSGAFVDSKKYLPDYTYHEDWASGAPLYSKIHTMGRTPLMIACSSGFKNLVKCLFQHGADIGATNCQGFTPLIYACLRANRKLVEYLVTNGANIEVTAREGLNPLMAACGGGNAEIVEFLLDQGANTEVADRYGCTPFDYAWCSVVSYPDPRSNTYNGMNFCKMRDFLLEKGARGEVNYERCKEMEAWVVTHKDLKLHEQS